MFVEVKNIFIRLDRVKYLQRLDPPPENDNRPRGYGYYGAAAAQPGIWRLDVYLIGQVHGIYLSYDNIEARDADYRLLKDHINARLVNGLEQAPRRGTVTTPRTPATKKLVTKN